MAGDRAPRVGDPVRLRMDAINWQPQLGHFPKRLHDLAYTALWTVDEVKDTFLRDYSVYRLTWHYVDTDGTRFAFVVYTPAMSFEIDIVEYARRVMRAARKETMTWR